MKLRKVIQLLGGELDGEGVSSIYGSVKVIKGFKLKQKGMIVRSIYLRTIYRE